MFVAEKRSIVANAPQSVFSQEVIVSNLIFYLQMNVSR